MGTPNFYQIYWDIVGKSVENMCKEVFSIGKIPMEINHTYVCLIPKSPSAANLKEFRPINLCNTTYKIITKIIDNRIRPLVENLIGLYQSSFLRNRLN